MLLNAARAAKMVDGERSWPARAYVIKDTGQETKGERVSTQPGQAESVRLSDGVFTDCSQDWCQ